VALVWPGPAVRVLEDGFKHDTPSWSGKGGE
jgi:hypothetical protein